MLQHFGDGSLDLGKTEKWFLGDLSFMYQLVHFRSHSTRIVWNYDLSQVSPGSGLSGKSQLLKKNKPEIFRGKASTAKTWEFQEPFDFH